MVIRALHTVYDVPGTCQHRTTVFYLWSDPESPRLSLYGVHHDDDEVGRVWHDDTDHWSTLVAKAAQVVADATQIASEEADRG